MELKDCLIIGDKSDIDGFVTAETKKHKGSKAEIDANGNVLLSSSSFTKFIAGQVKELILEHFNQ